ncbi:hypothetical protein GVY41_08245 [Frigidibacter albus]|uniref:Phosphomannomutase n=1 Tax=Frigidibacter albus TaxID=1465486 RepID=A0A6L8VF63_9RHOB|nr:MULTISPECIES: hypothetical protein [Frigidibacter]MDP3341122.1 hypothetical protein [Frigidibacter sp.]MZQ88955.1 hypothetical protein [Frigidibacter albus]NBE30988.1 hypothetical protein [Frigidibacter albus]GGH52239.1 hypothetical protein GCM10011341_16570 [Frigidibacter albus]
MFTIEHDFDATVITLVDEGSTHLQEDVTVQGFEDCVTVQQYDARRDEVVTITLSLAQVRELAASLDLPEGVYRMKATLKTG